MGKIVMPKNSALLDEIESVLQIYYEANDWLTNDVYKNKLKAMIGDDQYQSSYTKKAQITSYFGFTIWEDIKNPQSRRKITDSGKKMYEAIKSDNESSVQDVLMNSLETVKFGRNNYGCPGSNSDVEPPSLYIRAILDLEYLTHKEFAFLLWKLEDIGANYTDSLVELRNLRNQGTISLADEANKYEDCKPIMILVRWGFLDEDEDSTGGKHIVIAPKVKEKYETRLRNLKIYNVDMDINDEKIKSHAKSTNNLSISFETGLPTKFSMNRIVFGAPGTGKSHRLQEDSVKLLGENGMFERVTFHPDYTYANFVGTYKPISEAITKEDGTLSNEITYKFVPGPFMRVLVAALKNAKTDNALPHLLLIEEINRAKVAAVFGDVFQLLDRDDSGVSEYKIHASEDIRKYLAEELKIDIDNCKEIAIPNNMFIWATMNSADQGVFPMDTAFKRRWSFEYIGIDEDDKNVYGLIDIAGKEIEWNQLRKAINKKLTDEYAVNEDKLIGPYFLSKKIIETEKVTATDGQVRKFIKNTDLFTKSLKSKVLMYLYEDAAKQHKKKMFPDCSKYSDVCNAFDQHGIKIFGIDFETLYEEQGV